MKVYLVGGAVRDKLLGLKPKERDWVVVGSTYQEMKKKGLNEFTFGLDSLGTVVYEIH